MNQYPQQAVLPDVPRVGYDVRMNPFAGSLESILKYRGEPADYTYLMGVTGAAFRHFWNRDDGGNIDLFYLGQEPARRVLDALGYDWQWIEPEKAPMLAAIKESISRGSPFIAFGIIGPPEAGLVTGYARDGEVLYGWNYFQDDRAKYYERAAWFETMEHGHHANGGGILIGERRMTRPDPREVYASALRWAHELECASTWPGVDDHVAGLAAYAAWADALEADADYPADNDEVLGLRLMVHGDQCVMLWEREEADRFLRRAAEALPEAAGPLLTAAALYAQVKEISPRAWPWGDAMDAATARRLADPAARRAIAAAIREAALLETQAVEHLEEALKVVG